MDIANRMGLMSYDLKRKVGAIAVLNNNILSCGFNGTPTGFSNVCQDADLKTYPWVVHAEANLVAKAAAEGIKLAGSTVYVNTAPCDTCALLLIQSRVKEVIYQDDYKTDSGLRSLSIANIPVYQFKGSSK
jgi:dCMP deaminase